MSDTHRRAVPLGARALAGLALLLPPTLVFAWWVHVATLPGGSQAQKVLAFLTPLPVWLRSTLLLSVGSIGFCAVAVLVSYPGTRVPGFFWRGLAWAVVVVGSLLGCWNVFTLM